MARAVRSGGSGVVLGTLSHGGQSQGIALLRTHPVDSKRIADLQQWMPEAKSQFHGAKVSGAAPEAPSGKGATVISR
jgi:hypothetical protein